MRMPSSQVPLADAFLETPLLSTTNPRFGGLPGGSHSSAPLDEPQRRRAGTALHIYGERARHGIVLWTLFAAALLFFHPYRLPPRPSPPR